MKKLIIVSVGLIVAGCATTTQLEEIEKRLARIEGDLYKVEVKSAPKVENPEAKKAAEPKFAPAKEVDKNVVDAKVDAFLKEYLGVQFGDSIDKFAGEAPGDVNRRVKAIPVLKKFKYFDKARAAFWDGKLYQVMFYAEIDVKYSVDSTNEKMDQAFADLAVTLGLDANAFGARPNKIASYRYSRNPRGVWHFSRNDQIRRYSACIEDVALQNRLIEEKRQAEAESRRNANATGETLPDPE